MKQAGIEIFPLPGLPEIQSGDDLAKEIAGGVRAQGLAISPGDIFVIAQKIVSKSENRIVRLDAVSPSERAIAWAKEWGKDARLIELVLRESKRIVRMERGIIVAETRHGFVCANAGVDCSNAPAGTAILLPEDPDKSARALQRELEKTFACPLGIVISDTFGRPWREGLVNVALGVAGIAALIDYRGHMDASGNVLSATIIAFADELASAAELVMGKSDRVPVAIIRGAQANAAPGSGRDLIRAPDRDLFR